MTDERKKELNERIKSMSDELQSISEEIGSGITIDAIPFKEARPHFPVVFIFYHEGQNTEDGERLVMAHGDDIGNILFIDRDDTIRIREEKENDR